MEKHCWTHRHTDFIVGMQFYTVPKWKFVLSFTPYIIWEVGQYSYCDQAMGCATSCRAMSWLRQLVACLSPWWIRFNARPVHVEILWTKWHWGRFLSKFFGFPLSVLFHSCILLTLSLPTWRIWWAPNNASKGQMGFNLAFKGLKDMPGEIVQSPHLHGDEE
jgi:hypothetical protein